MQGAPSLMRAPGLNLPVRRRRSVAFSMTALADVLFQLLIFFMLSANLAAYSLLPLRSGALRGELTLLAPTVYGRLEWRLARPASWAFWRRPKPLATWARELAELAPPSHQSISAP